MRPPAPTLVVCRHGQTLKDTPQPFVCVCCGGEHRANGQLCLACRAIKSLGS